MKIHLLGAELLHADR